MFSRSFFSIFTLSKLRFFAVPKPQSSLYLPQKLPLLRGDQHRYLQHCIWLDPPTQTASRSSQPFFHSHRQTNTHTHRPTNRQDRHRTRTVVIKVITKFSLLSLTTLFQRKDHNTPSTEPLCNKGTLTANNSLLHIRRYLEEKEHIREKFLNNIFIS